MIVPSDTVLVGRFLSDAPVAFSINPIECLPIGHVGTSTGKTTRHKTGTRRNLGHPEHESTYSVLAPNSNNKTVEHKFPRCNSNL